MSTDAIIPLPATSPRASLGSMPTEVKARIVELAWIQDGQYGPWKTSELEAVNRYQEAFGRTLRALFVVNREFSELSAKYIFRSLSSTSQHDTSCTLFQHRILPLRALHFVHLTLNHPPHQFDPDKLFPSALFVASHLPNLRSLSIDAQFEELYLADNLVVDEFERNLVARSFECLASRIQELSLIGSWRSRSMLKVLRTVPALKKLSLFLDENDSRQDCRELLNFVFQQTQLEVLDLAITNELYSFGPDTWINFNPTSLPRLTSLTWCESHEELGGLLSRFSGQLVELSTSVQGISIPSPSLPLSFPLLRKLDLRKQDDTVDFVDRLQALNFPQALSLSLSSDDAAEFSTDSATRLLNKFPSLVSLTINCWLAYRLSATQSTDLLQLCGKRNIQLVCNRLYSPFAPSVTDLPMTLTEHRTRKACMVNEANRVVDFTSRRIGRLNALGDMEEIERMMPLIQGLAEIMKLEEA